MSGDSPANDGLDVGARMRIAVDAWKKQLIDTGGRNRLLYYRPLRAGTADLTPKGGSISGTEVLRVVSGAKTKASSICLDDGSLEDLRRRCRAIYRKAQENLEEKGLDTLILGVGLASWDSEKSPAAPVILVPVELIPVGAGFADFSLEVSGDIVLNPTMVHFLTEQFGISEPDFDIDTEQLSTHGGVQSVLAEIARSLSAVPGFRIEERFVLGNFTYTSMPMVVDLEQSIDLLASHVIVGAIAGDPKAAASLRGMISDAGIADPDRIAPRDEFLVLDADASQNWAINAAVDGQPIVIEGPPGTGKSQTIANLIATLVARQKRVLFVAEKRAAIEAVTKRLNGVGLGDIFFDLHGGVQSKRTLAQSLAQSLDAVGSIGIPSTADLERELTQRRTQLNTHDLEMHKERRPWRVSVWELQRDLVALVRQGDAPVRLTGAGLAGLDPERRAEVAELLREWVALGGNTTGDERWRQEAITSLSIVDSALGLVTKISHELLPDAVDSLDVVARDVGLPLVGNMGEWAEALTLVDSVSNTRSRFSPEVFASAGPLVETLSPARHRSSRWKAAIANGDYRSAIADAREMLADGSKPKASELLTLIELAAEQQRLWSELTDSRTPPKGTSTAVAAESLTALGAAVEELKPYVRIDGFGESTLDVLASQAEMLAADSLALRRMPRRNEIVETLRGFGLGSLLKPVVGLDAEASVGMFDLAWRQSAYEQLLSSVPYLATFAGEVQHQHVKDFLAREAEHFAVAPHRVLRAAAELAVREQNEHPDEAQLVRSQAGRRRRHLPLRALLEQAPNVLTSLRPCWAMSPILVAQLLPRSSDHFDVVIFDEASQITPAHAISALSRAKTAVVAGDRRQLPPTSFFGVSEADTDTEDADDTALTSSDFESVMDVMAAILRSFTLTWHYRSRDERLISFSNSHIYENMLTTFPGPDTEPPVSFVEVPHRSRPGQSTRSNPDEVARVADLVLSHARDWPEESLGVIAMGIVHANNIDDEVRRRLSMENDPALLSFFDESLEERFFVKNLERVQGDEREAIILSVGYGKDENGRLLYRFGPINGEAGERRLNVAVSRARARMTLVASFGSGDLDPNRSTSAGVKFLRHYLQFAESGGVNLGDGPRKNYQLNPFEFDVLNHLKAEGLDVTPQYGVGSYSIDFAVAHPDQPGRMILAVEADGASYHSSNTARDRDRLRQQVLEAKGWRFHRIWSTDWFRDPATEVDRVLATYRDVLEGPPRIPAATVRSTSAVNAGSERKGARPRIVRGQPISEYTQRDLVALAEWINSDGLLRTDDQLFEAMKSELGFLRRGSRIDKALNSAIAALGPRSGSQQRPMSRAAQAPPPVPAASRPAPPARPPTKRPRMPEAPVKPQTTHGLVLAPYATFSEKGAPTPSNGPSVRLTEWMIRIVQREGPVTADRVYSLLVRSAGLPGVTHQRRSVFNRVAFGAQRELHIEEFKSPRTNWPQRVLSIKGSPPVLIRERGPRDLLEIPLNELAAVMMVLNRRVNAGNQESVFRDLLSVYDIKNPRDAGSYLNAAWELCL